VFDAHDANGLSHFEWFKVVEHLSFSGGHVAKLAGSGTGVSENHKGGRSRSPTFTHIRAFATLTNRVKFIFIHQLQHLSKMSIAGYFGFQPVGLGSSQSVKRDKRLVFYVVGHWRQK
jgi:hypothetical protein